MSGIAALLKTTAAQVAVGLAAGAVSEKIELPKRMGAAIRVLAGVEEGDQTIVGQGLDAMLSFIPDKSTLTAAADLAKAGLTAASPRYAKTQLAMEQLKQQGTQPQAQQSAASTQSTQAQSQQTETNVLKDIQVSPKTKATCSCLFKTKVPIGQTISGVGAVTEPDGEPMCDECRAKAHVQALYEVAGYEPTEEEISAIGEVEVSGPCDTNPPDPRAEKYNGFLGFDDDLFKADTKRWKGNVAACKKREKEKADQAKREAERLAAERKRSADAMAQQKANAEKQLQNMRAQIEQQRRQAQQTLEREKNAAEQQRLKDQIVALQEREKLALELQNKVRADSAEAQNARSEIEAMSMPQLFAQLSQIAEQRGAPPQWSWGMGPQYTPGMQPPPSYVPPPGYATAPWGGFVPVDPNAQPFVEQQPVYTTLEQSYGLAGVERELEPIVSTGEHQHDDSLFCLPCNA